MKATLEFNLPEESEEYQIAVEGIKWRAVVSDALEELRRERKYAELSQGDLTYNEKISEKIGQLVGEQGLSL
jgi:hypothetical protein